MQLFFSENADFVEKMLYNLTTLAVKEICRKRISVVLGLAVPAMLALPTPGARAGTYELDWVNYYYSDSVSSPVYNVSSSGPGNITVTAQATGSGSGSDSHGSASGYLSLEGWAYSYVAKGYRWEGASEDWNGPADYKITNQVALNGNSSVQTTGSCSASATGTLVGNNQSYNLNNTFEWINSGESNPVLTSYATLETKLDASFSNGTVAASITQSGTIDISAEAVPNP
jgi:hypothetical protein